MGRFRRRQQPVVEAPEEHDNGPVPARFNFARDVVEAAAGDPFRSALTYVDREGIIDRRTFKTIASDASRWSSLLRSRGLAPGDRVLVLVGKTPAWHSVLLGALKAGMVTVPCPDSSQQQDVAFRAAHSGARLVVVDAARASVVEGLELAAGIVVIEDVRAELGTHPVDEPTHDTAADDTAFILYTSGTMGEPRGVIHTHANTWAARLQAGHWLDARRGDLIWCTAGTGTTQSIWNVLLGPWSCGAEVALHDGVFDVDERYDLLQRLGVTVLCQTPTEYRLMAEHPELEQFYLGSIRHAVATGEPLSSEVIASFRIGFGFTIHDGYGQTENTILVANLPGTAIKPGSMGKPTPEHEVSVLDPEGNEQLVGVEGEIALRGHPPSLFGGYWKAPEETRSVFRSGWYLTGDRAIRDQDGYLWFAGRSERVTVSAADRIQPYEIKSLLEADDRPVQVAQEENARLEDEQAAGAIASPPVQAAHPDEVRAEPKRTDENARLEEAQAAAAPAAAAALAAEAVAAAAAEAARQARGTDAEARRAAEARQAALARVEAEEHQRLMEAQRRDAAIAAAAQVRRDEAEARRAAEARVDTEAQQRQEEARRREAEIGAAAQVRRDEAEARRAAEASDEAAGLQRQAEETRRREAEQVAAAAAAAEQARREEAESRRAAETRARAEEQQRKQEERQRREAEKAAAEQARRDEAAARRAAETRAKEEERQRKQDEKQRREAEKAAAEQSRRDEAARKAAETRAREEEEQGRAQAALLRAAEKGRKATVGSRSGPPTATAADEEEEGLSPELIDRLRAYGHGDDIPKRHDPTE